MTIDDFIKLGKFCIYVPSVIALDEVPRVGYVDNKDMLETADGDFNIGLGNRIVGTVVGGGLFQPYDFTLIVRYPDMFYLYPSYFNNNDVGGTEMLRLYEKYSEYNASYKIPKNYGKKSLIRVLRLSNAEIHRFKLGSLEHFWLYFVLEDGSVIMRHADSLHTPMIFKDTQRYDVVVTILDISQDEITIQLKYVESDGSLTVKLKKECDLQSLKTKYNSNEQ